MFRLELNDESVAWPVVINANFYKSAGQFKSTLSAATGFPLHCPLFMLIQITMVFIKWLVFLSYDEIECQGKKFYKKKKCFYYSFLSQHNNF